MHAEHVERRPAPRLRPWVSRLAAYDISGATPGTHVGMPSADLTVVLPLDEVLTLSGARLRCHTAFRDVVSGLHPAPVWIHHEGTQRGVQISLTPDGARALLGVPAAALAGENVGLDAVLGARADEIRERIHAADGWVARLEIVEEVLTRVATDPPAPVADVRAAWDLITGSGGRVPVREVATEVGWSPRHLTARFTSEYGVGPKTLSRLVRFSRSVDGVRVGARLADVAIAAGYADQAHMTREWSELAGLPPTRWVRSDELAFVQDEAASR